MSVRSRYKEQFAADKGPQPSEKIELNPDEPSADSIEVNVALPKAPSQDDEATARLKGQLEALQNSEELQRHLQADQGAVTFWRQNGVPESQLQLLLSQPGVIRQLTHAADQAAAQHHQQGTPEHLQAAVRLFKDHVSTLERDALLAATPLPKSREPAMDDEPDFVPRPPPPPPAPAPDDSSKYSAPVSREVQGSGYRPSPSSVRLTPEMREAARMAGVTEVEYAKQFARLSDYKRTRGTEYE
jgi:hypothetical protein